jgi:hypothetical protein
MNSETAGNSSTQDEKDDSGIEQDNCWIYIRIAVEDLHLHKVLKFNVEQTVWNAKQKVLQGLPRVSGASSRAATPSFRVSSRRRSCPTD